MRIATVSDSDALHVRVFAVEAESYAFVHKMYFGFTFKILTQTKGIRLVCEQKTLDYP